jgi:hypothetical protein
VAPEFIIHGVVCVLMVLSVCVVETEKIKWLTKPKLEFWPK